MEHTYLAGGVIDRSLRGDKCTTGPAGSRSTLVVLTAESPTRCRPLLETAQTHNHTLKLSGYTTRPLEQDSCPPGL
jgi:hypothetical protein